MGNYSRGYPEAYNVGFVGITSDFWRLDRFSDGVQLLNKAKDAGDVRKWDNALSTSLPRLRFEVEVLGSPMLKKPKVAFRIFNSSTFRILDLEYQMREFDFTYEGFKSGVQPDIIVKDSGITIDPNDNAVAAIAAVWDSYNPQ